MVASCQRRGLARGGPSEWMKSLVDFLLMADQSTQSFRSSVYWELLKLLLVPIALAFFGVWLNANAVRRERMQDYLTSTSDLALKVAAEGEGRKIANNPTLRSLVRLRTLLLLGDSSWEQKRQIIEFLANSDLHYQISLERANLSGADLSGLYLRDIDLRRADLRGTNLDGSELGGATLKDAVTDSRTSLKKIKTDVCTVLPGVQSMKASLAPKCRTSRMG